MVDRKASLRQQRIGCGAEFQVAEAVAFQSLRPLDARNAGADVHVAVAVRLVAVGVARGCGQAAGSEEGVQLADLRGDLREGLRVVFQLRVGVLGCISNTNILVAVDDPMHEIAPEGSHRNCHQFLLGRSCYIVMISSKTKHDVPLSMKTHLTVHDPLL